MQVVNIISYKHFKTRYKRFIYDSLNGPKKSWFSSKRHFLIGKNQTVVALSIDTFKVRLSPPKKIVLFASTIVF